MWRTVEPGNCPEDLHGFDSPLRGADGFTMPATQHDVFLWITGSAYDVVFDISRAAVAALGPVARLASELIGWPYRHDRDLTGFIDGTENPPIGEACELMGRTKAESEELADKPADSHVARTDQEELGKIFRRNMPYGTVSDHGTIFVGLSNEQRRLHHMLERMSGCDGPRDALTNYTRPVSGAYYFLPAVESIGSG